MIRGSKDRAEEVREIIKSWGGQFAEMASCDDEERYFYVDKGTTYGLKMHDSLMRYLNCEIVELPNKKEKQKYQFNPFDRVLGRDSNEDKWMCDMFSHYDADADEYVYVCVSAAWKQCIPFEGNEELVGTTNEPKGGEE